LLAENARTTKEALQNYEKGVAAGERAIGPRRFQEDVGHFWGLLDTRPYMRAREGLAQTLWTHGRGEEAVGHLQDLLRLNPDDNQGVRYELVSWLLLLDRESELAGVLAQYDDPQATWAYTRALLAFRRGGDTPESRQSLKTAEQRNKFITRFLLGEEPIPDELPDSYSLGSRHEAICYIGNALCAWKSTPGAITWVRRVVRQSKITAGKKENPRGPSAESKRQLGQLPQAREIVQADIRRLPKWIDAGGGEGVIPWVVLVASQTTELILTTKLLTEEPSADLLWDILSAAIEQRPAQILVRPDSRWTELQPHLSEVGIELKSNEKLEFLDLLFADLVKKTAEDKRPGLLDAPRVSPDLVAPVFAAAADFYRRAPWRFVGDERAIKVECHRFESGPWYAVIMGRSGITLGMALYEDLRILQNMWAGDPGDRGPTRRSVVLAITFDPETDASAKDFVAAKEYGWEVVDPEAFPLIYRKEPGMVLRPPLAWELALLEGCLRAIPDFISRHKPGDMSKEHVAVTVASGSLDFVLSWVEED
jgi:hypothetical protein